MPIRIGTSGWSYDDWNGHVYPKSVDPSERLPFYARRFATVEVDSTYYRDPAPQVVRGWIAKTKSARGFELSVKTSKALTHEALVDGSLDEVRRIAEAWRVLVADPLAAADRLGAILLQLSPGVLHTRDHMARLEAAIGALRPHRIAVEFRNKTWHTDTAGPGPGPGPGFGSELKPDALALLDAHDAAAVIVDGPPFPPILAGAASHAYVRFHGRRFANWHKKEEYYGQRYDYEYSDEELDPWAKRLAELAKEKADVRVFFNNHVQGKAFRNGETMEAFLERDGTPLVKAMSPQTRLPW